MTADKRMLLPCPPSDLQPGDHVVTPGKRIATVVTTDQRGEVVVEWPDQQRASFRRKWLRATDL